MDAVLSNSVMAKKIDGVQLWFWGAMMLVLLLSVLMRLTSGTTPDVSWLIDMNARMLDGEVAYVDIFETTPPVPVLLYMPGAWAEQVTGMGAEVFVYSYFYAIYLACLWLAWRLLPPRLPGVGDVRFGIILPSAIFLFLLSHDSFAQRETIAAALALPMVSLVITYFEKGNWVRGALPLMAIIAVGLSAAIKPPVFALPVLLLGVLIIWRDRSLRSLWRSGLILAGGIAVITTIVSLMAFPEYLGGVMQLMRDIYVPVRAIGVESAGPFLDSLLALLLTAAFIPTLCLTGALALAAHFRPASAGVVLMVMSVGYIVVFMVQGKYFDYHIVPAAMFAFVAIFAIGFSYLSGSREQMTRVKGGLALVVALYAALLSYDRFGDGSLGIKKNDWAAGLEQPTAMALSPIIAISFPLARQIDARWIDRIHSQWLMRYARVGMEGEAPGDPSYETFLRYYNDEMARTANLIRQDRPDLIFQCIAPACLWLNEAMLAQYPDLLDGYGEVLREERIIIWRKQ